MSKANITIIVTIYNIKEYLPRFFDSISNQSYSDYNLLLVDDGSNDGSLELCKEYARKDKRIKVVELAHVGIAKARNIAMEYIDTPFVVYADGDDYVEKDYLKHLIDVQNKGDFDLVISRVAYRSEKNELYDEFLLREKNYYSSNEIIENIPILLDEKRLNYLYGKLYKADFLKGIRVEDDVKQGSDTMINIQVITNINNLALTDDLDYNYIKYSNRSVTSYIGNDAFDRLLRINVFIKKYMLSINKYSISLENVLDKRIIISGFWIVNTLINSNSSFKSKKETLRKIVNTECYIESYNRQKKRKNLAVLNYDYIVPGKEMIYLYKRVIRNKKNEIISKINHYLSKKYPKITRIYKRAMMK